MTARDVFDGGVRTLGVYFLANGTINILMIGLKTGSFPTSSHLSIFDDWVTFSWRFGVGLLLTFGGGAIARLVYGPRSTSS